MSRNLTSACAFVSISSGMFWITVHQPRRRPVFLRRTATPRTISADSIGAISAPSSTNFGMSPARIFAMRSLVRCVLASNAGSTPHARDEVDEPVRVSVLLLALLLSLSGHEDVHGILDRALLAS